MKFLHVYSVLNILILLTQATVIRQTIISSSVLNNATRLEIVIDPCWVALNCSLERIERTSLPDRLSIVQYIQTRLLPLHSSDQFRAIEGNLKFFSTEQLGVNGTWFSYFNAAVIEAIQGGAAIALGLTSDTGENPGASEWSGFFRRRQTGQLIERNVHDPAWAVAHRTAINYAINKANAVLGVEGPSGQLLRWLQYTHLHGAAMQYRTVVSLILQSALMFINPTLSYIIQAFIDWLTDVTDSLPTELIGGLVWRLALSVQSFNWADPLNDMEAMLQIVTDAFEMYRECR